MFSKIGQGEVGHLRKICWSFSILQCLCVFYRIIYIHTYGVYIYTYIYGMYIWYTNPSLWKAKAFLSLHPYLTSTKLPCLSFFSKDYTEGLVEVFI